MNILRVEFDELLISNLRAVYCLPISQDFTTQNHFIFIVEISEVSCIHRDKPNIIPALVDNITTASKELQAEVLAKVFLN